MKKMIVLASLFVSSFAAAAQQAELVCHAPSQNPNSVITGQNLTVYREGNGYKGMLFPDCRVCMVMPTEILFQNRQLHASQLIFSGRGALLVVALESLLPTKTHTARLTVKELNNGQPMFFTCQVK